MLEDKCPFCSETIQAEQLEAAFSIACSRCGNYQVESSLVGTLKSTPLTPRQRANISGWLSENPPFLITKANFPSLRELKTPSFHSRADKLLLNLEKETEHAGQYLGIKPSWNVSSRAINAEELKEILRYLEKSEWIDQLLETAHYKIAPDGWAHLEELKEINPASNQCFVAMWFDDKMNQIYNEAFAKGIEEAGYKPHRVDQRQYNDKIDDEIMAQIRRSRFIVCDFTGHRGGVYYEAGFAKGLGLQVIFTCRKDELDKLHFDVRQYNCIDWQEDHLPEFIKRLTNRIESVFGHGSYRP